MTTEKKRRLIIDVLFIGVILFLVYFFMKYIAIWTLPFLIGLVAAIVLQKPVNFLTAKTKLPRTFWSVLLVIAVLLSLFGIIGLLIWYFVSEAGNLADWLMGFVPDITATFENVSKWFSKFSNKMPEGVAVAMQGAPGMIVESLAGGVADFATAFAENFLTKGPGILITVIFSVVSSCYITKDYRKIANFVLKQLSERKGRIVINAKKLFVTNILKMLRGYIIIMFITFCELFIGLSILGVDYAALLAVIIAVLDILPVIGTGAVIIPWGVVALLMGKYMLGAGLLIMYILIVIVRNIIEPRIIGQQVGLPPIVTLIAMYVGLKTFGVIGMMLFPVCTIILVKLQDLGVIKLWNKIEDDKNEKQKKKKKSKKILETVNITVQESETSEE